MVFKFYEIKNMVVLLEDGCGSSILVDLRGVQH